MEEEQSVFDLPEDTLTEIIDKIYALTSEIRNDWNDPRGHCRAIWALCEKAKKLN